MPTTQHVTKLYYTEASIYDAIARQESLWELANQLTEIVQNVPITNRVKRLTQRNLSERNIDIKYG